MKRPRDFQRQRVYTWEREVVGWKEEPTLSLPACISWVRRVHETFGEPAPEVTDGRGRRSACYDGGRERIALPTFSRKLPIVLHECAHALLGGVPGEPGHGPTFVRLYLELLVRVMGYDRAFLVESARAHGLKITPLDSLPYGVKWGLARLHHLRKYVP